MNGLSILLIMSILAAPPASSRYPMATEVFHCSFDKTWDKNFDLWPDEWVRRRGPRYPLWISMKISSDPVPVGGRCLRVDLNGRAASAYTKPIDADPIYDYVLESYIQTEGLRHDRAFLSVTFLDEDRRQHKRYLSETIRNTDGWVRMRLGPMNPSSEDIRFVVVGVHVEPGKRADLSGTVRFGDLWLARLPRVTFTADRSNHLYPVGTPITVTTKVSGLEDRKVSIRFALEDVFGNRLSTYERPLETEAVRGKDSTTSKSSAMGSRWIGSISWDPPVPGPGFYRVRTSIPKGGTSPHQRVLSLTVIEPQNPPVDSVFGWSLADGGHPSKLSDLSSLILQSGVRRVKFPFWYDRLSDPERTDRIDRFSERLTDQGIRIIGLLNNPPESVRSQFEHPESLTSAELFSATPDIWLPSLEAMLTHSSVRIDWWQLGDDTDRSYVGYPNLAKQIESIKAPLHRLGSEMNLGFAWGWLDAFPRADAGNTPWRFLALSADPPLTYRELEQHGSAKTTKMTERWLTLRPLPAKRHSLEVRVEDLIRRMMAAQKLAVEGIFAVETPDRDDGLLQQNGKPNELFLPWRTTALLLGGSRYVGSVQLPHASENHVFSRDGQAVMVVFNQHPTEEPIHIGSDIRQVDPWGINSLPKRQGSRHRIRVGKLPSFVTGVNTSLILWRQKVTLDKNRIPANLDNTHSIRVGMTNTFAREVTGNLEVITPKGWKIVPARVPVRLVAGETLDVPMVVQLPYQVANARHPIFFDFQIDADKVHVFRVPRYIDVGPADVEIKIRSHLSERGELVVEQRFVHTSDLPIRFRCYLYAPRRERFETQVIDLKQGEDVQFYRFPDGSSLLGKELWLKAEEIGGKSRVLNYRFQAKRGNE